MRGRQETTASPEATQPAPLFSSLPGSSSPAPAPSSLCILPLRSARPPPRLFSPRSALLSSFIAPVPHASGNLSRASPPLCLSVPSCRTSRASFLQAPRPAFPDPCSRSAGPRPPHFRSSPPSRFLLCLPSPVLPRLRAQKKPGNDPGPLFSAKRSLTRP